MVGASGAPAPARRWARWLIGAVAVLALIVLVALTVGRTPRATTPEPNPPATVAPPPDRPSLSLGDTHACRVEADGTVACWGDNGTGQLGIGIRSPGLTRPVRVPGLNAPVTAVAAGGSHTCALTRPGDVWCWGNNDWGQLGVGTTEPSGIPVAVQGLDAPVAAISAGSFHTCAVTQAGGVRCWGSDGYGQLGDGRAPANPDEPEISSTPVDVVGLSADAVAVSAAGTHTCAVTGARAVRCWGNNSYGQLGDGETAEPDEGMRNRYEPVDVVGLSGVVDVAAGMVHTCALTERGRVACWGANDQGQLGDAAGATPSPAEGEFDQIPPPGRSVPGDVAGLPADVRAISTANRTCAVTSGGRVLCWGPRDPGHVAGETDPEPLTTSSSTPTEVPGLAAAASVVAVGASNTCVSTAQGAVSCWGDNNAGQLGDGTTLRRREPVPLAAIRPSSGVARPVKINVIVVDSDLDVTQDLPRTEQRAATAKAKQLVDEEPVLMQAIGQGFRSASAGALDPTVQVAAASKRLTLPGSRCLDFGMQGDLVQAAARPERVDGAINIVVVKALLCPLRDGEDVGGYDLPEEMPVVGWVTLGKPWELLHTMIHEYGHDVGLLHAGYSDCKDPAAHRECTIDEVGDLASVMSYTHTSDAFTVAELDLLGFTEDGVVAAARDSEADEFHVGSGATTPSAVLFDDGLDVREQETLDDDRVYISGVPGWLEVRFFNDGKQVSSRNPESEASLTVVTWSEPQPGATIFHRAGVTVTYDGPDPDGNAILHVAR